MVRALRASPPARAAISARTASGSVSPSASSPRRITLSSSESSSGCNSKSWTRLSSAELTSKYGFSVVAPISVTSPSSTTGSSASCWALLKRWISSRKRIVRCPWVPRRSRARAITARTSFTEAETAESSSKAAPVVAATIRASVVLPIPGGPKKIADPTRSSAIARRSAEPSPSMCSWPASSSSVRGRRRSASGAVSGSRWAAASENRSLNTRSGAGKAGTCAPGSLRRAYGSCLKVCSARAETGADGARGRVPARPSGSRAQATTSVTSAPTSCSPSRRRRQSGRTTTSSSSSARTRRRSSG